MRSSSENLNLPEECRQKISLIMSQENLVKRKLNLQETSKEIFQSIVRNQAILIVYIEKLLAILPAENTTLIEEYKNKLEDCKINHVKNVNELLKIISLEVASEEAKLTAAKTRLLSNESYYDKIIEAQNGVYSKIKQYIECAAMLPEVSEEREVLEKRSGKLEEDNAKIKNVWQKRLDVEVAEYQGKLKAMKKTGHNEGSLLEEIDQKQVELIGKIGKYLDSSPSKNEFKQYNNILNEILRSRRESIIDRKKEVANRIDDLVGGLVKMEEKLHKGPEKNKADLMTIGMVKNAIKILGKLIESKVKGIDYYQKIDAHIGYVIKTIEKRMKSIDVSHSTLIKEYQELKNQLQNESKLFSEINKNELSLLYEFLAEEYKAHEYSGKTSATVEDGNSFAEYINKKIEKDPRFKEEYIFTHMHTQNNSNFSIKKPGDRSTFSKVFQVARYSIDPEDNTGLIEDCIEKTGSRFLVERYMNTSDIPQPEEGKKFSIRVVDGLGENLEDKGKVLRGAGNDKKLFESAIIYMSQILEMQRDLGAIYTDCKLKNYLTERGNDLSIKVSDDKSLIPESFANKSWTLQELGERQVTTAYLPPALFSTISVDNLEAESTTDRILCYMVAVNFYQFLTGDNAVINIDAQFEGGSKPFNFDLNDSVFSRCAPLGVELRQCLEYLASPDPSLRNKGKNQIQEMSQAFAREKQKPVSERENLLTHSAPHTFSTRDSLTDSSEGLRGSSARSEQLTRSLPASNSTESLWEAATPPLQPRSSSAIVLGSLGSRTSSRELIKGHTDQSQNASSGSLTAAPSAKSPAASPTAGVGVTDNTNVDDIPEKKSGPGL